MREVHPRRYPTDLSDAEWTALEPLLPPRAETGRPLKWPRRLMAEAIFYLVRSGCAWRMLPTSVPPWQTVVAHFRHWRLDGTLPRTRPAARAGPRGGGPPGRAIGRHHRQPDGAGDQRRRPGARLGRQADGQQGRGELSAPPSCGLDGGIPDHRGQYFT
jgi:transposase